MPTTTEVSSPLPRITDRTIAFILLAGAVGYGAYVYYKKDKSGIPSNVKIVSYTNLRNGDTVNCPDMIILDRGDTIGIKLTFDYWGPAIDGVIHAALFASTTLGTHDEMDYSDTPFNITETEEKKSFTFTVDLPCDSISRLEEGVGYGLVVYLTGTGVKDVASEYYTQTVSFGFDPSTWKSSGVEVSRNDFSCMITQYTTKYTVTTEIFPASAAYGWSIVLNPNKAEYNENETIEVDVVPMGGVTYVFDHWEINGSPSGNMHPMFLMVSANIHLKAIFV